MTKCGVKESFPEVLDVFGTKMTEFTLTYNVVESNNEHHIPEPYFTKEVNPSYAEPPLKCIGRLAKIESLSVVKLATWMYPAVTSQSTWYYLSYASKHEAEGFMGLPHILHVVASSDRLLNHSGAFSRIFQG